MKKSLKILMVNIFIFLFCLGFLVWSLGVLHKLPDVIEYSFITQWFIFLSLLIGGAGLFIMSRNTR